MQYELEKLKSQQACEILKELNLDAWLIWVRETSQMADPVLPIVFGGDFVWQTALIFTQDEKIAIVGNFDVDGVEASGVFDRVVGYTKGIKDNLLEELDRVNPKQIGTNYSTNDVAADGLTLGMSMLLNDMLEGTPYFEALTSAEKLISRLRGRKIPEEVDRVRKAVEITEQIFKDAEGFVKVGMTELEIYDFFHQKMREHRVGNAWAEDHNPAVDAGPNKQFGHAGPTDNKTKAGHLLHFDFGVSWNGYCSDIQRMFFFGPRNEIPEEITSAFEAVRDAIRKASEIIRPGKLGHDVDAVAREFVQDRGYEEYQHALGHQVGRHAHDGGTLLGPLWERYGDTPKGEIEVGNIFTLELYVTTDNFGQVSLEEDIVITKSGCDFLSRPQQELICIE